MITALVYLVPDALYAAAVASLGLVVALLLGAVMARRTPLRAERPSPAAALGWIDSAERASDSEACTDLLRQLARWPHLPEKLSDDARSRVARLRVRARETGEADPLRRWIQDDHRGRRIGALHLISWLEGDRAEPLVARHLERGPIEVAYAAAACLARIGTPSGLDRLLCGLGRGAVPDSRTVTLLEDADPAVLLPLLRDHADSGDEPVRFWVAHLAGRLSSPDLLPTVLRLSRDPVLDVRANAAEALGEIGGDVRNRLEELLEDPSWVVQAHAAEALGKIGPEPSASALAALLDSPYWWVRERVVEALARSGPAGLERVRAQVGELEGDAQVSALDALGAPA